MSRHINHHKEMVEILMVSPQFLNLFLHRLVQIPVLIKLTSFLPSKNAEINHIRERKEGKE